MSSSEFEHKSISDGEISNSEMAHFIKKKMKRSNKFNKKDVKEMFRDNKKTSITKGIIYLNLV